MATRKNLDLPLDDDVNINNSGITGKHLFGIGALVLAGLLGWRALAPEVAPPAPLASPPPAASQEYDVTFWVDGQEIAVTEPKE